MRMIGEWVWSLIEKIAYFFLSLFFRIIKKELTDEMFEGFMEFVRFGVVGLSSTVINYFIYAVSLLLFRKYMNLPDVDYYMAQIVAFLLSVLWSFFWNNRLVFGQGVEERSLWKSLLKSYVTYSFTGLFLSTALLYLWVRILHISAFVAPIINLLATVPLNFLINKFWTFKKET